MRRLAMDEEKKMVSTVRPWQGSPTEKLQLGWQDSKSFFFRDLVDLVGRRGTGVPRDLPVGTFRSQFKSLLGRFCREEGS